MADNRRGGNPNAFRGRAIPLQERRLARLPCRYCQGLFANIRRHEALCVNGFDKPYACPICHAQFGSDRNARAHWGINHSRFPAPVTFRTLNNPRREPAVVRRNAQGARVVPAPGPVPVNVVLGPQVPAAEAAAAVAPQAEPEPPVQAEPEQVPQAEPEAPDVPIGPLPAPIEPELVVILDDGVLPPAPEVQVPIPEVAPPAEGAVVPPQGVQPVPVPAPVPAGQEPVFALQGIPFLLGLNVAQNVRDLRAVLGGDLQVLEFVIRVLQNPQFYNAN